jgi:hypothetical protein
LREKQYSYIDNRSTVEEEEEQSQEVTRSVENCTVNLPWSYNGSNPVFRLLYSVDVGLLQTFHRFLLSPITGPQIDANCSV